MTEAVRDPQPVVQETRQSDPGSNKQPEIVLQIELAEAAPRSIAPEQSISSDAKWNEVEKAQPITMAVETPDPALPIPDDSVPETPKKSVRENVSTFVDNASEFVDKNRRAIGRASIALLLGGAIAVVATSRAFVRFRSVREIPKLYFADKRKIRGVISGVDGEDPTRMMLYHLPFLRRLWWIVSPPQLSRVVSDSIRIQLPGLSTTHPAGYPLEHSTQQEQMMFQRSLVGKMATVRLVQQSEDEREALGMVRLSWHWRTVAQDMVRNGLACVAADAAQFELWSAQRVVKNGPPQNAVLGKQFSALFDAQRRAQSRGLGLWRANYRPTLLRSIANKLLEVGRPKLPASSSETPSLKPPEWS